MTGVYVLGNHNASRNLRIDEAPPTRSNSCRKDKAQVTLENRTGQTHRDILRGGKDSVLEVWAYCRLADDPVLTVDHDQLVSSLVDRTINLKFTH